jgi:hypothetical protein
MESTNFPIEVEEFVKKQNYHREGPITLEEFSKAAFIQYGCFILSDLTLEQIVFICNKLVTKE